MLVFVIDALRLFGRGRKTNMSNSCGSESWPSKVAVESCSCLFFSMSMAEICGHTHPYDLDRVYCTKTTITPLRSIVISFGLILFALYHPQCFFRARLCVLRIPDVFLICVLGVTLELNKTVQFEFPLFFVWWHGLWFQYRRGFRDVITTWGFFFKASIRE